MRVFIFLLSALLASPLHAERLESAALSGAAGFGALPRIQPAPVAAPAGISVVDPSWIVVEGRGAELEQAKRLLIAAAAIIGRTPTGQILARTLTQGGGRVIVNKDGSFYVSDDDNAVVAGPDFVNPRTPAVLSPLFAHELEHLVQGQGGVKGKSARGARELGAFLVQCRLWIEAGAPTNDADWERNGSNSQDMWAWIEYPHSAMAALKLRGRLDFSLAERKVRRYWRDVLGEEASWRGKWSAKFPKDRDSREAALFILEQASRFAEGRLGGKVSPWLPDYLEDLAAGRSPKLPEDASAKDRAFIETMSSVFGR
ncbi:MAG: hypothetical protein ABIJ96_10125 [Elusimicrobiota bacterium]